MTNLIYNQTQLFRKLKMSKDQANSQAAAALLAGLLDTSLADVADLPTYLDYCPNGFYKLKVVSVEQKMVDMKNDSGTKVPGPVIQFTYEILETLELEKESEKPIEGKAQFSETIFFHKDPEKGKEVVKAKFKDVAEKVGWTTVADVIANLAGMEIGAIVKSKQDKEDKNRYYIQLTGARTVD